MFIKLKKDSIMKTFELDVEILTVNELLSVKGGKYGDVFGDGDDVEPYD